MENSKLSGMLWLICSCISLTVILFVIAGEWLLVEYVVVSVLAFAGWLKFSYKQTQGQNSVIPVYIMSIVLFLLISTIRYSSDFPGFIQNNYHHFFQNNFVVDHANWFVLMACLPASIMLLGGYFLVKKITTGSFFAWWGFIFCVAESIIQFKIELSNITSYVHQYFTGVFIAMGLFLAGAYGIMKLIKPVFKEKTPLLFKELNTKQINVWSIVFVALILVYATTLYFQAGFLPVGIIMGSMMGGFMGWRKTTARFPADPYKLLPLYLLLQALFYMHVGEESLTHFNRAISSISGHPWSDSQFYYLIALIGPIVWIFAAFSLWKGKPFGNYILWFMIVGMILGEPAHLLVFPVVRMVKEGVGYEYFPGMSTALFPMIPAILALVTILKGKKERTSVGS